MLCDAHLLRRVLSNGFLGGRDGTRLLRTLTNISGQQLSETSFSIGKRAEISSILLLWQ